MRRLALSVSLTVFFIAIASPTGARTISHWGGFIGGDNPFTELNPVTFSAEEAVAVQASNSSGYALNAKGGVLAWGDDQDGQLGDGSTTDSPETPVQVALPKGVVVVAVGQARNEGVAVTSTGRVFAWGANGSSSLCLKGSDFTTPVEVAGLSNIVAAAGGSTHMLFLNKEGHVFGCGNNEHGALGIGEAIDVAKTPAEVPDLGEIVKIASAGGGTGRSAAINKNGEVFMWGNNVDGQVGVGSTAETIFTPQHVKLPEPAIEVAVGGDAPSGNGAVLALTKSDAVFGWGDGAGGAIGDRSTENQLSPVPTGLHFVQIATGGQRSFGLTAAGEMFGWGLEAGLGNGRPGMTVETPIVLQTGVGQISSTAETGVSLSR